MPVILLLLLDLRSDRPPYNALVASFTLVCQASLRIIAFEMTARQDSDNLAWDRSDQLWEEKRNHIRLKSSTRKIVALAERTLGEPVMFVPPLLVGGFNVLYPIRVGGSPTASRALFRLPYRTDALFMKRMHLQKLRQ